MHKFQFRKIEREFVSTAVLCCRKVNCARHFLCEPAIYLFALLQRVHVVRAGGACRGSVRVYKACCCRPGVNFASAGWLDGVEGRREGGGDR